MRRATLKDVAQLAGVSTATVSMVVNGKNIGRIPVDTRKKVREAANALGYRPDAFARGLASGRSSIIGFLSDGVATSPFTGQMIRGAQDKAWRCGRILMIIDTCGDRELERMAFDEMASHRVEGVLYSRWVHKEVTVPEQLLNFPSVLVNCFDTTKPILSVVPDEVQGGYNATRMLLDQGHRKIALVLDPDPTPAFFGRLEGYRQALREAGIAFRPSLVLNAVGDQEGGYRVADALLATDATGVFCYNDRTAMGLYDALRERTVDVPSQMSVVGFDDQEVIAKHLHPPLSTVALPQYELGVQGVRELLKVIKTSRTTVNAAHLEADSANPIIVKVSCNQVPRDSVARVD